MFEQIVDLEIINRLSKRKRELEAMLTKELYEIFSLPKYLIPLQKTVGDILIMMVEGVPHNHVPWKKLRNAVREEPFLRLWKENIHNKVPGKLGKTAYIQWRKKIIHARFDPTDCGDIFRLAGAWVEQGGGVTSRGEIPRSAGWEEGVSDSVKSAYRPGVDFSEDAREVWEEEKWYKKGGRFYDSRLSKKERQELIVQKRESGAFRRDRGSSWDIEENVKPLMRDSTAFSGMGKSKRAQAASNVLKIERICGTIVGGDISGTTTDTLFELELWGRKYLSVCYYLLPLATIVHNMHHSFTEVALSISLNKEADYTIGFYSSMLPGRDTINPILFNKIKAAMEKTEKAMRDEGLHFIRYYEVGAKDLPPFPDPRRRKKKGKKSNVA